MTKKTEPAEPSKTDAKKLASLLSKFEHVTAVSWLRTGVHAVDLAIGGGIPLGRVIEVFGNESAGKSLLGWTIIRAFQRLNGVGVVFDCEATAPHQFMTDLGVDMEMLVYEQPKTVEEIRERMCDIVAKIRNVTDVPIVIMWDSVAAASAKGEWEKVDGEMVPKESPMAARARAMSDFFKHYTIWLTKNNVTLICINQLREKIGVLYGRKTDSPGGHALKHHATVRIELTRGKKVETDGKISGIDCHMRVEKNKVATPFRKAQLRINWGSGFDAVAGLEDILIEANRVKQSKPGHMKLGEEEFQKKDLPEIVTKNPTLIDPWI